MSTPVELDVLQAKTSGYGSPSWGRRRTEFVGRPTSIRQVTERAVGATRAIADVTGMTPEWSTRRASPCSTVASQEKRSSLDLADRTDAVFEANDLLAIGVSQGLRSSGVAVPDDIDFASSTEVFLSSIRQPNRGLGNTAVGLLLERVSNPLSDAKHIVFQPELVIRSSTSGLPTN